MRFPKPTLIVGLFLITLTTSSCSKYLDKKSDSKLSVPTTITDLQMLLDNYYLYSNAYSALPEIMSDNFYVTTEAFNSQDQILRDLYLWKSIISPDGDGGWSEPYRWILTTNLVLDIGSKINEDKNSPQYNNVMGSSYFLRAYFYYILSQLYCTNYEPQTTNNKPGLVLKLTPEIGGEVQRSTIQETYQQILTDLKKAMELLPNQGVNKTRPTKASAYGTLSKVYLSMQLYDSAAVYANKTLAIYDSLMDYNDLNYNATAPIPKFNKEVVFMFRGPQLSILAPSVAKVDSNLYNSYKDGDLRKKILFKVNNDGTYRFRGDYDGFGVMSGYLFGGIVTDEINLIKAECLARKGMINDAMFILNKLLKTRWDKLVPYIDETAITVEEAVEKVINERRKELINRGTRWTDLRRLRFDPLYAITPKRIIDGKEYTLPPQSPRFTLLIPIEEINQSGIEQNP